VNNVVRAERIGKYYRLGELVQHDQVREALSAAVTKAARRLSGLVGHAARTHGPVRLPEDEGIWALRDISFAVEHGEILGVIGRNGSGKSTLLKILSRITPPTEGRAEVRGRVGSLLEVGTGFQPDLTGRENVFLNGAILGMTKADIRKRFDEIVAFAEVERFIDTPVKRYSDGMYMRLAFAVAAHLEPDILIVDEVLAVGDANFQKKCLGRMGLVAKGGRTVLFVSHNLLAVEGLCSRVIWLDQGKLVQDGRPSQVVSNYLQTSFSPLTERKWHDVSSAPGDDYVRLHRAVVRPAAGGPSDPITVVTPFVIEIEYWNLHPGIYVSIDLQLYNEQDILVFDVGPDHEQEQMGPPRPAGLYRTRCHVPGDLLNARTHRVVVNLVREPGKLVHEEWDVLVFEISEAVESRQSGWYEEWEGVVRPKLDWNTEMVDEWQPTAVSVGAET
jgi:lipopolysaccharide transport system ATP-binding protein